SSSTPSSTKTLPSGRALCGWICNAWRSCASVITRLARRRSPSRGPVSCAGEGACAWLAVIAAMVPSSGPPENGNCPTAWVVCPDWREDAVGLAAGQPQSCRDQHGLGAAPPLERAGDVRAEVAPGPAADAEAWGGDGVAVG